MSIEEFIEHHGVKGMRWGVRQAVSSRVATAKRNRKPSADSKKVKELSKRQPKALTNKQLKTINERRNLEKNFRSTKSPSSYSRGKKFAAELLAVAGMIGTGYAFVNSPAGKATIAKGKHMFDMLEKSRKLAGPYQQLTLF